MELTHRDTKWKYIVQVGEFYVSKLWQSIFEIKLAWTDSEAVTLTEEQANWIKEKIPHARVIKVEVIINHYEETETL